MSAAAEAVQAGWDSQRGEQVWAAMPVEQQRAQLAQTDRILLAAQGLRLDADGQARQVGQMWRVPKK